MTEFSGNPKEKIVSLDEYRNVKSRRKLTEMLDLPESSSDNEILNAIKERQKQVSGLHETPLEDEEIDALLENIESK